MDPNRLPPTPDRFDIDPISECAVDLPIAGRIFMFVFHQLACPILILVVYLQACLRFRGEGLVFSVSGWGVGVYGFGVRVWCLGLGV